MNSDNTPHLRHIRPGLGQPAAPGGRHTQAVSLAGFLAAKGLPPAVIFQQLRGMYPPDVSDKELRGILGWVEGRESTRRGSPHRPWHAPRCASSNPPKPCAPEDRIRSFLRGTTVEAIMENDLLAELHEASPWRLPEDWTLDAQMLLAGTYEMGEFVNIVTESNAEGGPSDRGETLTRSDWLKKMTATGTPQGPSGAWIRMNPTDGHGVADVNITHFRFALLELDTVPLDLQLALFSRLPVPIVALITSGGRSVHAWVNVGAKDIETYRAVVVRFLGLLKPFGCDQSNKNPSRLSRLPGANRPSSDGADKRQRLVYFAPDRTVNQPIL